MNFNGTNGSDVILGTADADTINGLDGHDVLEGLEGNDVLFGGAGFDQLKGGLGDDTMTGGTDTDTFYFEVVEIFNSTSGQFEVHGFGHDVITDFDMGEIIDIDTSFWPGSGDFFDGFEIVGNDTILRFGIGTAQESSITVQNYHMQPGDQFFQPFPGFMSLSYNPEASLIGDDLTGDTADDHLFGYGGNDTLDGLGGNDRLYGGNGNDTAYGGEDADDLYGEAGNDTLFGGLEDDELYGGLGNDSIDGGAGYDDIHGGRGDDTIASGADGDGISFFMEEEFDPETGQFVLHGFGHNVITDFSEGDGISIDAGLYQGPEDAYDGYEIIDNATVFRFAVGTDQESSVTILNYHVPDEDVYGGSYMSLSYNIEGSLTDDDVVGTAASDDLYGYGGDDTLTGLDGDDHLQGDNGDDTLNGGADRDNLYGGAGNDTLTGGTGDDHLRGEAGNDTLDGGAGYDELFANLGDDTLTGGTDGDTFYFEMWEEYDPETGNYTPHSFGHNVITDFSEGDYLYTATWAFQGPGDAFVGYEFIGNDTVMHFATGTPQEGSITIQNYHVPEGELFPGDDSISLFFNEAGSLTNDLKVGTEASDFLDGYAGNDTLDGLGADDHLNGGSGNDTLFGGGGADHLFGGDDDDVLQGGAEDDQLFGEDGDDLIDGGTGFDWLYGGLGTNTLTGGADGDTFSFQIREEYDPVTGLFTVLGFGHNVITDFSDGDNLDIQTWAYQGPEDAFEGVEIIGSDTVLRFATGTDQESTITIQNYHLPEGELHPSPHMHHLYSEAGSLADDLKVGTEFADFLDGYAGNDTLDGLGADDHLNGGTGGDTAYGGAGFDHLFGGDGDDTLDGGTEDDQVFGDAGDDDLTGGAGYDNLDGGLGNDVLTGGVDGDVFTFFMFEEHDPETGQFTLHGFGHDVITDFADGDFIDVQAWSYPGDAFDGIEIVGADTVLRFAVGTDQESSITIQNYHMPEYDVPQSGNFVHHAFNPDGDISHLNQVIGTNGIDNLLGSYGDDLMIGGESSDNLNGSLGNDILDPGAGGVATQILFGQQGDDTYIVGANSGTVRISHWSESADSGFDRVVFRDLDFSDITMTSYDYGDADGQRMLLSWQKDGEQGELHLAHMGAYVEELVFADGSAFLPQYMAPSLAQIVGTDGEDTLRGTNLDEILVGGDGTDHLQASGGDDVLDPGAGGDGFQFLYGQAGDDTYLIGQDVGTARINIWSESASTGSADVVHFTDLLFSDLIVSEYAGSGADGTELRLSWDTGTAAGMLQIADLGQHIETFVFADGTTAIAEDFWLV